MTFPVPPLGMASAAPENDDFLPAAHVKVGRGPLGGRTKMRTRHLLLALFALAATGCVSEDLPPQPGYVSTGHDGVASVAPSVTGTGRGTIATNSSRIQRSPILRRIPFPIRTKLRPYLRRFRARQRGGAGRQSRSCGPSPGVDQRSSLCPWSFCAGARRNRRERR